MQPIKFPQAYEIPLGAGGIVNTGDMFIRIARDPNTDAKICAGDPRPVFVVSCWEMTAEELEVVRKTGKVYIAVMANEQYRTQAPICVHAVNPFDGYRIVSEIDGDLLGPDPEVCYIPVARTFAEEQVENIIKKVDQSIYLGKAPSKFEKAIAEAAAKAKTKLQEFPPPDRSDQIAKG
jgi:hypothetical protein